METYKIEVNKEELKYIVIALNMYKAELYDIMLEEKCTEKYNWLSKRRIKVRQLMKKLEIINDPPF